MNITLFASCFVLGGFLHICVFSRNEWDRHSPRILLFFCLLNTGIFACLAFLLRCAYIEAVLTTIVLGCCIAGGLFASMTAYRLLFHPLKSFPGPIGARISTFWYAKESIPDMKFYCKLRELHDQYGDFIRIRPRELSIRHPDAVVDVHGPKNKIRKGEFYEHNYPLVSLQLNRDPVYHKQQRKYWDKAFHAKSLNEYTPRLKKHYTILMSIFAENARAETPIDASKLLVDLFFDIISDLTFGKSFDALTMKHRSPIIKEFLAQQKTVGFFLGNIWLFCLLRWLPPVDARIKLWMAWYERSLDERQKMTSISPDLFTYLFPSDRYDFDRSQDAQLAVIAGADTNAITISNACYLLCCHTKYQVKLYTELKDLPVSNGLIDDEHLVGKPYLSAIINEVLRLYPPVPSGMQRLTPPEGATIAGRFIPGDMIISTPTYAVQRDPRAFVQPDDFIPERWTSRPELTLRRDAFTAFGYGAYNCAGKPLAMLQLRMVLAMIIRRFEISIPPGREDEFHHFIEEQSDCFTVHLNPLPLLLRERKTG